LCCAIAGEVRGRIEIQNARFGWADVRPLKIEGNQPLVQFSPCNSGMPLGCVSAT
jgi:hypothetical protein